MEKTYSVTWTGYFTVNAESEEEAIEKFIRYIEEEETDAYARDWKDFIDVEEEAE